jgi:hypothetical protein
MRHTHLNRPSAILAEPPSMIIYYCCLYHFSIIFKLIVPLWGNKWGNSGETFGKTNQIKPKQTTFGSFPKIPINPSFYRDRRPLTAAPVFFLRDSVGIRNGLVELVYLWEFSLFCTFVWGNIWLAFSATCHFVAKYETDDDSCHYYWYIDSIKGDYVY